MVRATALEQDKKREKLPQAVSNPGIQQRRRRAFGLIFFAILLLIVLGGAALFGVGIIIKDRATTPATQYPSLIFAESTETLADRQHDAQRRSRRRSRRRARIRRRRWDRSPALSRPSQ